MSSPASLHPLEGHGRFLLRSMARAAAFGLAVGLVIGIASLL